MHIYIIILSYMYLRYIAIFLLNGAAVEHVDILIRVSVGPPNVVEKLR